MANKTQDPSSARGGRFTTTHWSLVLAAAGSEDARGREALAKLCQVYWYPLYAFVRRQGHGPHEARDLTQEFFLRLLEKDYLADVDRSKGKFRSFLLAALKHFLSKERARAKTLKRGGGHALVPLDIPSAEDRYRREPEDNATPEKLFERRWALTLLDRVLTRLSEQYETAGKGAIFKQLQGCLTGDSDLLPYAELAA
ncbi:MAG: RNA polymerase subunit sigma-24, partial [Thermoguttaceae bacterium]